jgi:uncharacterized protein
MRTLNSFEVKTLSSQLSSETSRTVVAVVSTSETDRMGDIVVQSGIDLTNYRRNPVVLWAHDATMPIARCTSIDIVDGALTATMKFPDAGADQDSDRVLNKIRAGLLNATSIGFRPIKVSPLPKGGLRFDASELMEFSIVSIPANAGALIQQRSVVRREVVARKPLKWF